MQFRPLTDVQIQGYDLVSGKSAGYLPLTLVIAVCEKHEVIKNITNNPKTNNIGRGKQKHSY